MLKSCVRVATSERGEKKGCSLRIYMDGHGPIYSFILKLVMKVSVRIHTAIHTVGVSNIIESTHIVSIVR